MWSLSWIRTCRSVGWSLMKECLSNCSVDGRLGYVFTRQPSIKSINFLDLEQKRGRMIHQLEKRERRNRRPLAAGAVHVPTHDSRILYQRCSVEKSAFNAWLGFWLRALGIIVLGSSQLLLTDEPLTNNVKCGHWALLRSINQSLFFKFSTCHLCRTTQRMLHNDGNGPEFHTHTKHMNIHTRKHTSA